MHKFGGRVAIGIFIAAILLSIHAATGTVSTTGLFNITPNTLILNWTNSNTANVTLTTNATQAGLAFNITLGIFNVTRITGNYSQVGFYTTYSNCTSNGYVRFVVLNASNTSIYTNQTTLNNNSNESFTLMINSSCPPGRYYGQLIAANISNQTDNATVNVTIDIPISTSNELNATTGIATFYGTIPVNMTVPHSFYINLSQVENIRSLTVNLTWNNSNKDIDIFLFDPTGNLTTSSRNNGTNYELLNQSYPNLSLGDLWEIRVFGNFTTTENYTGKVYITTLNLTNATNNATLTLLDFGVLNVSNSRVINITLKNDGNVTSLSTVETMEIYHQNENSSNTARNYTFVVPSYATKVAVLVNWTGNASYNITLFAPNGTAMANSTQKNRVMNLSGVQNEEKAETTSIAAGVWRAEVINNTNSISNYTIRLIFYVQNTWLTSNYTTTNFNLTGQENSTKNYIINLTVPNTSLSGTYKGTIFYKDSKGAVLALPFNLSVSAATLLVNETFLSDSLIMYDNIGFNRSGSDLQANIVINNTGNANMTNINCTSTTYLNNSVNTINFTYNCPASIEPGQSANLQINFTINDNQTANTEGLYTGWIYLNASNNTYPYRTFNLSLIVNLSANLSVNVTQIITMDGNNEIENVSRDENVTVVINVSYLNGSQISTLKIENFSIWVVERNVTDYRWPTTVGSSLDKFNGTNPLFTSNIYSINVTIPTNLPGGRYLVYVSVNHTENNITYRGSNSISLLLINKTGIKITPVTTFNQSVEEGSAVTINVTLTNFGPVDAKGNVSLSACSNITVAATNRKNGCGEQSSTHFYDINISGNGTETCWYTWTLTTTNVSTNTDCAFKVYTTDTMFSNATGIINITDSGGSSSSGSTSGGSTTTCTSNSSCASTQYCDLSTNTCVAINCSDGAIVNHVCVKDKVIIENYTSYFSSIPGGTNSTIVTVKNIGGRAITIRLGVVIDTDINVSLSSIQCSVGINADCSFIVNFSTSNSSSLGNHTGKFIAYSTSNVNINDEKTFKYEILSTPEREATINELYANLSRILDSLATEINALKPIVPADNMTELETLFNESKNILASTLTALNNKDYPTAESLLRTLSTKLNETNTSINVIKEAFKEEIASYTTGFWTTVMLIVGAVIVVFVIGLLIYLLLPPAHGYIPGQGYRPKRVKAEKLKHVVKKISNKAREKARRKEKLPWER